MAIQALLRELYNIPSCPFSRPVFILIIMTIGPAVVEEKER